MAEAPNPNQDASSDEPKKVPDADETVESIQALTEADAEETAESIRPPEEMEQETAQRAEIGQAPPPIPPPPPTEPAANPQEQLHLLFELLAAYATRFRDELKQVSLDTGKPFHPKTGLFEITSHMLYLMSIAMLDHRQEMDVLKKVMIYCQAIVCRMKDFEGLPKDGKHVNDVIVSRVEQYTQVAHKATSTGKIHQAWVRFLRKNLDASRTAAGISASPEYVQNDAEEKKVFRAQLLWVYERFAGEFMHCLKQIFEASQDVRTLSTTQMQKLVAKGQKEHRAQIAARMKAAAEKAQQAPTATTPPAEAASEEEGKKKWWKPWSSQAS